jgi:hypothetical protein
VSSNDDDNAVTTMCILPKKKNLTSCGKCLTHWHEEEEGEGGTLVHTICLQNSDNDNAYF